MRQEGEGGRRTRTWSPTTQALSGSCTRNFVCLEYSCAGVWGSAESVVEAISKEGRVLALRVLWSVILRSTCTLTVCAILPAAMTVPLSCSPLGSVYLLAEDEAARVQVHAAAGRGAWSAVLRSVFMFAILCLSPVPRVNSPRDVSRSLCSGSPRTRTRTRSFPPRTALYESA